MVAEKRSRMVKPHLKYAEFPAVGYLGLSQSHVTPSRRPEHRLGRGSLIVA